MLEELPSSGRLRHSEAQLLLSPMLCPMNRGAKIRFVRMQCLIPQFHSRFDRHWNEMNPFSAQPCPENYLKNWSIFSNKVFSK